MSSKKGLKINLFELIMISCSVVVSIRNLPTIAEAGMHMVFFAVFAGLFFFIPAGLVSAELASAWPKLGGVAVWVREAFGKKWEFVAAWLQWVYTAISIISMLYFIGSCIGYIFDSPTLGNYRLFLFLIYSIVVWLFTYLNSKGLHTSSIISTVGFLGGVILPGVLIIIFGAVYYFSAQPIHMDLSLTWNNLVPNFKQLSSLVLLVALIRAFSGIEVSAAHANNVKNPQASYPIAFLIVVVAGILINILGPASVGMVIPKEDISLVSGLMDAFQIFFKQFDMLFLLPIFAILVIIGQMGEIGSWLIGPIKALLETAKRGEIPPMFQKVNDKGVPVNLIIFQGLIITLLGGLFLFSGKTINHAFWLSVVFTIPVYGAMYILMFAAAIKLRYTKKNVLRPFKIPCKNIGIWVVSVIGILSIFASIFVAMIPPDTFPDYNLFEYVLIVSGGSLVIILIPFFLHKFKNPKWAQIHEE